MESFLTQGLRKFRSGVPLAHSTRKILIITRVMGKLLNINRLIYPGVII